MDRPADSYRTLRAASKAVLFKEKKSKFFGYAFPLESEMEVKPIIEALRKKHHTAGHVCYAWQLGTDTLRYRAHDDGEPNNSAGPPIYGQLQAFELTNVLVAVVRIYGGTKLGVGGLIAAYRAGARMALEASQIVECFITDRFSLTFDYTEMDVVMRLLKQGSYEIEEQQLELRCRLLVRVRKSQIAAFERAFANLHKVLVQKSN